MTWQAVRDANKLLPAMQSNVGHCCMWYQKLGGRIPATSAPCPFLALYVISDSAFKNMSDRRSQRGYVAMLVLHTPGRLGGPAHILELGPRKSRCVAKSTWSAELHAFIVAPEKLGRLHAWLDEIYCGGAEAKGLQRLKKKNDPFLDCYGIVDCKGLFDSLTSPTVGSLLDVSMQVYLMAAREAFAMGPLNVIAWVPTTEMLADGFTKALHAGLNWERMYSTGRWDPSEAIICRQTDAGGRAVEKFGAYLPPLGGASNKFPSFACIF